MSVTIFLVDEFQTMRVLLAVLLDLEHDLVVVGQASEGLTAVDEIARCRPDVVVLDLVLPFAQSLAVVKRIRALCPSARVILLKLYGSLDYALTAFAAGVYGFVVKEAVGDELVEAIRTVYAGKRYLSRVLLEAKGELPLH